MESCDINQKDPTGDTPLAWAAGNGHERAVKVLLAGRISTPTSQVRTVEPHSCGLLAKGTIHLILYLELVLMSRLYCTQLPVPTVITLQASEVTKISNSNSRIESLCWCYKWGAWLAWKVSKGIISRGPYVTLGVAIFRARSSLTIPSYP